MICSLVFKLCF
ncbi:putative lipoprotein, partial [Yersinia pestis PY-36]